MALIFLREKPLSKDEENHQKSTKTTKCKNKALIWVCQWTEALFRTDSTLKNKTEFGWLRTESVVFFSQRRCLDLTQHQKQKLRTLFMCVNFKAVFSGDLNWVLMVFFICVIFSGVSLKYRKRFEWTWKKIVWSFSGEH